MASPGRAYLASFRPATRLAAPLSGGVESSSRIAAGRLGDLFAERRA